MLAASAGFLIVFPGTAGEPIRFVRPKSDEKAPLRVNYSAEPAQAKEKRPIGLPEDSSGTRLSQTISVNRRARDATRKKWTTSEPEAADTTAARARIELQRWRMSQMEDERPSGPANGGGLFGLGENREPVPGGTARPGGETTPSRAPSDFGLRGLSEPSRSPGGGNAFSPWGWNAQPTPSASSPRPEIPSSPSGLSPAFGPRIETESPGLRTPSPAPSPYTPRNFELPGRPR
jgi:hypothetical protein